MIRRIAEEGPRVIVYRGWQLARLWLLRRLRYWPTLEKSVNGYWDADHIEQWLALARSNELLIGPKNLAAFRRWSTDNSSWSKAVEAQAADISEGRVHVFGQEYQFSLDQDGFPWHTDWRWGHSWDPAYYKAYDFYVRDKNVAYDVKFPWELSRLSFLLPLAEAAATAKECHWRELIAEVVVDWEEKNPVAYSVNWCAMESSMRGISLALVAQILAADSDTSPEHVAPLLRELTLHGEFLWRNIEFTDVRGNHYAANLVALLLMGSTLRNVYQPAVRWANYSASRTCREIQLQYCQDGVNFEKSTAYHRLVTELFLIGLITMGQAGYQVSQTARDLIHKACDYTRCYMRPDDLSPNFGDNDSARVLGFYPVPLRDHRPLLALGAAYFGDEKLKAAAQQPSAMIPLLLGSNGVQRWDDTSVRSNAGGMARLFRAGGMFVSRTGEHYLCADFGEVGMNGRGGHGHNDTFSFELCLSGKPLLVDSGSPVYSGDLEQYDLYRSTGYHNTVRVDGREIARLLGRWRISNEASPASVEFRSTTTCDTVEGEHQGYARLSDPVVHQRALSFYRREGRLVCRDTLQCVGSHHIEQFLHFAPGTTVKVEDDVLYAYLTPSRVACVSWTPCAHPNIVETQISNDYGHLAESQRLVLEYDIVGETELGFEIALVERQDK